jgi:uncharacterized protein YyaL (SSP411 family)
MALEDVAPVLGKQFIPLKLDTDRSKGADDVLKRYAGEQRGGIPWFAFIAPDGKAIITSTGPKGNVGMPWEPHEVEHFRTMLEKAKTRLTDADVAALIASIQAFRKQNETGR